MCVTWNYHGEKFTQYGHIRSPKVFYVKFLFPSNEMSLAKEYLVYDKSDLIGAKMEHLDFTLDFQFHSSVPSLKSRVSSKASSSKECENKNVHIKLKMCARTKTR